MSGREDTAERDQRALELHLAGASYAQIARIVGLASKSSAHDAVKRALAAREQGPGQDVTEAVETELARLDAMLAGLWNAARRGDTAAVDRVLKIGERRTNLLAMLSRKPEAAPEQQGEGVPGVGDIAAARARRLAAAEGSAPT